MRGNKVLGVVCEKHLEKKVGEGLARAVGAVSVNLAIESLDCDYCGDSGIYIVSWMERPT